MAQKIRVVKAGYNAITEINPDNIVFSSDYDTLKYYSVSDVQLTVDFTLYYHTESAAPFGTIYYHRKVVEVTHGLGYVPFFIPYLLEIPASGAAIQLPFGFGDAFTSLRIEAFADNAKIYFLYSSSILNANTGSATYNFRLRLFRNDLGF